MKKFKLKRVKRILTLIMVANLATTIYYIDPGNIVSDLKLKKYETVNNVGKSRKRVR